jgi:exonuclease SbcD
MRLLHTADWHLGRTLCGQPFLEEQAWYLFGPFLDIVKTTRPDAVIVAGDIYDRAVPPADAVELLGDVLQRIVRGLRIPVVMIPGNHDDDRRLAFAADLLRDSGLFIADSALGEAFPFADAHGAVTILAAGYGTPAVIATLLGPEAEVADHDAGFAAMTARVRSLVPPRSRSVLVAHAFVQGGLTSESERALQVGGTGAVSAAHLAGFDYVALGHLHRRQALDGGRIAYSGSPLAYSFSEAGEAKSVSLVVLGRDGLVTAEAITVAPRRQLRSIHGTLAEVLAAADEPHMANGGREDWLQVTLTDRAYGAKPLLNERYPSVLDLRFEAAAAAPQGAAPARVGDDPLGLFEAFWRTVGGDALGAEERRLAAAAITAAAAKEA